MKKAGLLLMVLILIGCNSAYPPPVDPVCSRPEAAGSVICATAQRLNLTPEQLDAVFLDAALIGIGTKVIQASELQAAVTKTQAWVKDKDILTIKGLTAYLITEATVDPALALLLSRRLGLINLPDLGIKTLTAYDRELVLYGLQHQLDQLTWF